MDLLSRDLLWCIGEHCSIASLGVLAQVNHYFAATYQDKYFWSSKLHQDHPHTPRIKREHSRLMYITSHWLSQFKKCIRHHPDPDYFFIYGVPPLALTNKRVTPDICLMRRNRRTGGFTMSDIPGSQTLDVIIVVHSHRTTINGPLPLPHFEVPSVSLSSELYELIQPYWLDCSHMMIFDIQYEEYLLSVIERLPYQEMFISLKKDDRSRYHQLWD